MSGSEAKTDSKPDGASGGKLWGGRFQGGLDPFFAQVNQSLGVDLRLAEYDIIGSSAWALALAGAGVITQAESDTIDHGLRTVLSHLEETFTAGGQGPPDDLEDEDIHSLVERLLTAEIGPLAKKLHTGRSRNDQVATDLKLLLREMGEALEDGIAAVQQALVALAQGTAALPMPGFTHLQRAQPITVGHWALAYVEMLHRDRDRLLDALVRMDTCPLGSGALAGTAFPVDRESIANNLAFEGGPTRNSLDAVSDRDHAVELAFTCSLLMVHLSRLAEDTIFFCSQETAFARFGDSVSTGSSLMPQKRNPDAMELVRGKAGRVCGDLQALLMTLKGLPLAYNKDMQEDKEALFDALDTTTACLRITATAIGDLAFDEARCRRAATTGFLDATDLADLLVQAGVAFRDAHEQVGTAVNRATELGVELRDLPAADRRALLPQLDGDLSALLSVEAVLGRRDVVGGTCPKRVHEAVAWWQGALASMAEDQAPDEPSDAEGGDPA